LKRGLLASVLLVCLICFGALAGVLGAGWSPKLGLDLEGGLSVVFQPVHKATSTQLQTVVSIMQARANGLGLSSPNIGTQGSNIVVQLPGVKDFAKVISEIGNTSQLFFRPVLCAAPAYTSPSSTTTTTTTTTTTVPKSKTSTTTSTTAAKSTTTTTTPAKAKKKATTAAYVKPPSCGSQYLFTVSTYIVASGTSGAYNPGPGPDPALATVQNTPALQDTASRTVLVSANPASSGAARYELGPVAYDGTTPATGAILASASSQYDATSGQGWLVNFTVKSQYSAFFDTIAKANYHLPLAIDLGGYVESAPTINAQSFGGQGEISGDFSQSQANDLALVLEYGQIPIALKTATYTTVSPTLGKHSLQAGLLAGLLGLLLVMGYTIFYYRSLGVVVVLGLVSTGALIYAIISLLGETSASLTLDLSGMTGLIVSVGITVDSYIVYFERLKDEVRAGRSVRSSVDRGFKSAYRTILSADAVSFLGALVLWILSIGAVRGFAFMLGLSTIIDVITAYTFTRPLVILLGRNRIFTDARIFGVARGLAAPAEVGT
jgi:preprotein translocase subunit SecD